MPELKQKTAKDSSKKLLALIMRYFNYLPPVIMILIVLLGYFFLVSPKYKRVKQEIDINIEEQEQELKKLENYLTGLSELKREFKKIDEAEIEKINKLLPDKPEAEEILVELESIILKNGLSFSKIGLNWTEAKAGDVKQKSRVNKDEEGQDSLPAEIGVVNISFSVSGLNYNSMKRLLNILENNLRLFDINDISYSPDMDSVELEMSAYYMQDL